MNNQQTCLLYIVCLFVEKISKYLIPQLLETFRQVGEKGKQFLKKYFMDGTGYHLIVMMTIDDNGDDRSNGQAKSFVLGQKLEDKQVEALASLPSNASFLQKLGRIRTTTGLLVLYYCFTSALPSALLVLYECFTPVFPLNPVRV